MSPERMLIGVIIQRREWHMVGICINMQNQSTKIPIGNIGISFLMTFLVLR